MYFNILPFVISLNKLSCKYFAKYWQKFQNCLTENKFYFIINLDPSATHPAGTSVISSFLPFSVISVPILVWASMRILFWNMLEFLQFT